MSDAGKCRLMRYWKRQGKPGKQEWPLETLKAMQLGINIHEYIQQIVTDLPCGITRAICEQVVLIHAWETQEEPAPNPANWECN